MSRALLLSVALHLALLGLIRIAPVGYETAVTVLQVHLSEPAATESAAQPAMTGPNRAVAGLSPATRQTSPALAELPPQQPAVQAAGTSGPAQAAIKVEPPAVALSLPSPVDLRWYGPREVDALPKQLDIFDTERFYPWAAKRQRLEGWVKVRMTIDEYGVVRRVEALEGNPPGVFDAAAVEASLEVKFEPARRGGRPVRYEGNFRVSFELK